MTNSVPQQQQEHEQANGVMNSVTRVESELDKFNSSEHLVSILKKNKREQTVGKLAGLKKKAIAAISSENHLSHDHNESGKTTIINSKMTRNQASNSNNKRVMKPRRRVATIAQRRAANIRERRRMFNLNAAFDRLRKKVPSFAYEKRLSRIETLKLAIMYIRFMDDLVNDDSYVEKYKRLLMNSSATQSCISSSQAILNNFPQSQSNQPIVYHNNEPPEATLHRQHSIQSPSSQPPLTNNCNRNSPCLIGRPCTNETLTSGGCQPTGQFFSATTNCNYKKRYQEKRGFGEPVCCSLLAATTQSNDNQSAPHRMGTGSSQAASPLSSTSSLMTLGGGGSFTCCSSPASSTSKTNCTSLFFAESASSNSSPTLEYQASPLGQQAPLQQHSLNRTDFRNYNYHLTPNGQGYDQDKSNQPMSDNNLNSGYYQAQPSSLNENQLPRESGSCSQSSERFEYRVPSHVSTDNYSNHHQLGAEQNQGPQQNFPRHHIQQQQQQQQQPLLNDHHSSYSGCYSLHSLEAR